MPGKAGKALGGAAKRAGAADRNYRKYKKTAGTDPEE